MRRPPRMVDTYIDGIDPQKRTRGHRGILRQLQFSDVPLDDYLKYIQTIHPDYITPPQIGQIENDGYYYSYSDEWTDCPSLQESAAKLNRNRSTLNGYLKHKHFPAICEGQSRTVDIIAAQDWILLNSDHHAGLEPYWPDRDAPTALICLHADDLGNPDAEWHLFGDGVEQRIREIKAA